MGLFFYRCASFSLPIGQFSNIVVGHPRTNEVELIPRGWTNFDIYQELPISLFHRYFLCSFSWIKTLSVLKISEVTIETAKPTTVSDRTMLKT